MTAPLAAHDSELPASLRAQFPAITDWLRLVMMYRAPHPESARILEVIDALLDHPYRTHALLLGEPGTGKEGLARGLHAVMSGSTAPFVKMPTGGRDPQVLALHLFGTREQRGAIARAEGGTLFLDEIGTMPRELQARLAPVLAGHYRRNDDSEPQPCDVSVICATDHDLAAMVEAGSFRHDLYYRISRLQLTIPALRARPDDIPRAALWAGNRLLSKFGRAPTLRLPDAGEEEAPPEDAIVLTEAAIALLKAQPWPGNFRELDRVMERALFLLGAGAQATKTLDEDAIARALA